MSQVPVLIKIPMEHLPATICNFLVKPGDKIAKSQSLLSYEYKKTIQKRSALATEESEYMDVLTPQIEELKSPTEGELEQFHVKQGETIDRKNNKVVVGVIEPCSHSIQLHGLCALCGTDITTTDHNGIEYAQRATISMAHNVFGLTVSLNEAERLEKETSRRLLEERKLSLIVDLDQTLIHATIDPTVEEWIKDGNDVAEDVRKFTLPDSPIVYYIKLRPGLKEFLRSVSKIYEPHIYTMGTRNYASAVANVIDPDNTIFNERILSRDESGSMTQKDIRRLFPCDNSMVVVIDDRADVWSWSPNLIKVHPYDFFVGIGDINDTYLPKRPVPQTSIPMVIVSEDDSTHKEIPDGADLNNVVEKEPANNALIDENNISFNKDENSKEEEQNNEVNSPEIAEENNIKNDKEVLRDVNISEEKSNREPLKVNTENNTSIDALLKPVQNNKRSFEEISDVDNVDEKSAKKQQFDRNENNEIKDLDQKVSFIEQKSISRPMLADNDTELPHLLKALENIHKQYYEKYDSLQSNSNSNGTPMTPDVTNLIPQMKSQVLKGVNILFTHVIPTNQKRESSDIWILAKEFGAECSANWNNEVTHLVAGDRGTEKVREANRKGDVYIVRKEWLDESIKKWARQLEKDYTLEPNSPRDSETSLISEVDKPLELIIETPSGTDDDDALLSPEIRMEHYESTDWRSALNEVDELLAESGDTSALDESETETESGGRKRLKRYGDVLEVDDRNAKRLKQSPLRQSITFNNDDDDDENESEQAFDKVKKHESDSFYSELTFDGGAHDNEADEVEQDYEDEDADDDYDYGDDDEDYDPGNQSDDEGDDDFDDDEYVQLFEENLRQPNS
ncbi:unnamed protein product [Rhizophagus irregularis]|uniref:RNA polymerase II subunit A C-terminal domain phosphatase n=1 Tax=Rhizophagus irregularis TaxID=588596 RepID=A0A2I1GYJ7_9GLOM|nr:hypothetical protein RhiirA4_424712 [Rhizophagus irregularis]CAB4406829.1 unnamed protein product [Rhizophagus irregularis]